MTVRPPQPSPAYFQRIPKREVAPARARQHGLTPSTALGPLCRKGHTGEAGRWRRRASRGSRGRTALRRPGRWPMEWFSPGASDGADQAPSSHTAWRKASKLPAVRPGHVTRLYAARRGFCAASAEPGGRAGDPCGPGQPERAAPGHMEEAGPGHRGGRKRKAERASHGIAGR